MKYEDRVVAFIDILGFASLLEKTKIKDKQNRVLDNEEYISSLYNAFSRIRELMGVDEQIEGIAESRQVTQFSDAIVISFDKRDEPSEFRYMLGELLHLSTELLKSDILIRGGVSFGSMIHTEKALFGPAMVSAHLLESKAAKSPRIILPRSLYDKDSEFQALFEYVDKTGIRLDDLLSRDEDDFYYLDYFDKCSKPELRIFANDKEYTEHLKRLRRVISTGLKISDPGIYSKYGWMKTKWNRTIKKYQGKAKQKRLLRERRELLAEYYLSEKTIETAM
jgi:hypothetical protein